MSEYIPSTDVVREWYALFAQQKMAGQTFGAGLAEFDRWAEIAGREQYLRGVQAARDAVSSVVPHNFELNHDGTEDKLRAAYVEGVRDAWGAIGELL